MLLDKVNDAKYIPEILITIMLNYSSYDF